MVVVVVWVVWRPDPAARVLARGPSAADRTFDYLISSPSPPSDWPVCCYDIFWGKILKVKFSSTQHHHTDKQEIDNEGVVCLPTIQKYRSMQGTLCKFNVSVNLEHSA
ncbi:hypothetical protein OUZ56_007468 [Daphnia magna]|uniref:Uncharacterized protein n=1 Tax=Daphnia magna TaxID=35525 RepID=A0ABR0AA17_9CRUS|nr:hypothetical protein OUZ56_007468 [Daphnia magna]